MLQVGQQSPYDDVLDSPLGLIKRLTLFYYWTGDIKFCEEAPLFMIIYSYTQIDFITAFLFNEDGDIKNLKFLLPS